MAIDFKSRSQLQKLKKIAEGGEAEIYEYDAKTVLKVFKPNVDIRKKEKKVNYFISVKNTLSNKVIGPQDYATLNKVFFAYVMKKLMGTEDLHMLTKSKYLIASKLSNRDVLEIVTILGKEISKLHSQKILIGDISDYNFQMVGKTPYFVDVDSWGREGQFSPDAYTELFTCPDSYMPDGTMKFSFENENYNFAVLAFNMLTRIHPFGGTYLPDKNLSTTERMKKKISVLGKYQKDIKIPKIIGSWKWISPKLEQDFIDIFENGSKMDIVPDLQELFDNMAYCKAHDGYYYSKYSKCPVCNDNAKVKTAPVVTKATQTSQGPQIAIVFSNNNCAYVLSNVYYLNKDGKVVHFETGRTFDLPRGKRVSFSKDGKLVFVVDDDTINIYNENDKLISTLERAHKSNYRVKGNSLYYIDKGNLLIKLDVTPNGNMPTYYGAQYNPLFEMDEKGGKFIVSLYPKTAVISTDYYNFELDYKGKIKEYAIKYDKKTDKWLFVYHLPNGKYRTLVFNRDKIEYDDDIIMYNADTLGNIDFYNNTIFDPSDEKIIGINLAKNTAKEFDCKVVDESSKLKFTGTGFIIYNKDNIYSYG